MPFLKTFQLSMYAQVFLASGMLATAEGGASPSFLTFVVGVVALIFNDQRRVFGLSEWWANGLALGAFCVATGEFLGDSPEAKLLAGTHLIVYLLWIVLLWKREIRHFWWICALCLLQVALSSVLTQAGWFGMVLVVYVLFMVWNLTLFSLYRAEEEVVSAPTVFASETGAALLQATARKSGRSSQVQGNVQSDFGKSHVGSRLAFGALGTSVMGLLVGSLIFILIPRVWLSPNHSERRRFTSPPATRSVTGFTEKVRLGDIGEILESNDPVLALRVFDNDTGKPQDVMELANAFGMNEPYLRGSVLVNYRNGTWEPFSKLGRQLQLPSEPQNQSGLIRQEITLEPLGTNLLFAMRPFGFPRFGGFGEVQGSEHNIVLQTPSYTLIHKAGNNRLAYRIYSHSPVNPPTEPNDFLSYQRYRGFSLKYEQAVTPGPKLRRLNLLAKRIAARVEKQSLQEDAYTLAVARELESYLRDSGEYSYTLNAAVMDPQVDPLEDFLFNRKAGHCEYYAAALTLMLRSVGIPARLINGFKGGEYDPQEKVLRVEQRHAHSWVEAAIGDRWLTLDATPVAERERIVASHKPEFWDVWKRKLWGFWNENVLSFSLARQDREIFQPMMAYLSNAFSSTAGMRAAAADFGNWFWKTITNPQRWISFDGGILAFLLLGIPVILFYAARRLWRRLRRNWVRRKSAKARPTRSIEFYQRFQVLAQRMGFVRQPQQTQREFSAAIQHVIDASATEPEMQNVSNAITDSFYRVRFGDDTLNDEEQQLVDQQLQLVEALSKRPPG